MMLYVANFVGLISTVQPTSLDFAQLLSAAQLPLIVTADGIVDGPMSTQSSTFTLGHSIDHVVHVCTSMSCMSVVLHVCDIAVKRVQVKCEKI